MSPEEHRRHQREARRHIPAWLLALNDVDALPAGFETCWGFLYRTSPLTLLDISGSIKELAEEDRKGRVLARRYREPLVEVETKEGVIGAYTRVVLHEVFR